MLAYQQPYTEPVHDRKRMLRVLMLSWEYPPYIVGGMGSHVAGLVPRLGGLATDHGRQQVDLITTRYAGGYAVETVNDFVTVHRLDLPPLDPHDLYNSVVASNEQLLAYARQLVLDRQYDLIHIHDWLAGPAGVALKYEWKVPLVTTIHATERGRHQGQICNYTSQQIDALEWQICHEAWRVIVCSNFMRNEVHRYFQQPQDKISVIPNGIDPARLYHCRPEERRTLRTRYAPNGERLLFYVGRIVHEKGLHVLLQAMPKILSRYPDVRLLVGGKNSRKMWPLAHELGVERSVVFLDFISDQERDMFYQIADAAIFPSLYEPFGIVALEAMALGCNVIASDVGGLGEVVQHLVNGLTVYPNDPDSIAWAVDQLFSNPTTAQQRRARALSMVRHHYNWSNIARQTSRVFETVVTERRQTDW
ncbi:MAG: glycosyl transferase family 1 [Litorilinea sp.]|nr:MAG: glycosyl transferase family 1 [Litorilinea sp.]